MIGGFSSGLVVVLLLVNMQYADKKGHWGSMCGLLYAGYQSLTSKLANASTSQHHSTPYLVMVMVMVMGMVMASSTLLKQTTRVDYMQC